MKLLRLLPLLALTILGCAKPSPDPVRPVAAEPVFPVRADWMVVSTPKATPSGWYVPGRPPLGFLDEPAGSQTGDAALLGPEVTAGAILNTKTFKHFEEDPRPLIQKGLDSLFGTPAEPRIGPGAAEFDRRVTAMQAEIDAKNDPDEKASLKEDLKALEGVRKAWPGVEQAVTDLKLDAATLQTGGTLYRNYCQQCHGLTGDGNGPGGKYLQPLPRDYRAGVFKFLTSEPSDAGTKPRRSDLARTIRNGLDGSAMPSFAGLKWEEIDALTSYVIFLSVRGESEFQLMKVAADKRKADDFVPSEAEKTMFVAMDKILNMWQRSDAQPFEMQPDPYTTDEERLVAAARGHRIFLDGTQGGCTACHLNYGRNALFQFDAWGGITRPRNLFQGTYRVSKSPEDLYARLYCGIPGVGMPSHKHLLPTAAEKENGQSRLWDLVHFVRAVGDGAKRRDLREKMGVGLE